MVVSLGGCQCSVKSAVTLPLCTVAPPGCMHACSEVYMWRHLFISFTVCTYVLHLDRDDNCMSMYGQFIVQTLEEV